MRRGIASMTFVMSQSILPDFERGAPAADPPGAVDFKILPVTTTLAEERGREMVETVPRRLR